MSVCLLFRGNFSFILVFGGSPFLVFLSPPFLCRIMRVSFFVVVEV